MSPTAPHRPWWVQADSTRAAASGFLVLAALAAGWTLTLLLVVGPDAGALWAVLGPLAVWAGFYGVTWLWLRRTLTLRRVGGR